MSPQPAPPVVATPAPAAAERVPAVDANAADGPYIGLVTRALAAVIDAVVVNVIAIFVEVGAALILTLVHLPKEVQPVAIAIGAAAYGLWVLGYFVGFWSGTGQTPGCRVMQIRVVAAEGGSIKPRRALVRCVGVFLAALPLFLGFLPILFDRKRRGLQDYVARTVVIEAPKLSLADIRRKQFRAAHPRAARADAAARATPVRSSDSGDDRAPSQAQA